MNTTSGTHLPHNLASELEELLDFLPGVVAQGHYSVDGPKSFLYVSRGAVDVFGVTREQLLADSQLFFTLCHPDDREALKASIRKAVSNHADWRHSWRICHSGEPDRWVRVSSRHLQALPDGSTIRVSNFIDISREKKLEGELRLAMQNAEQANNAKSIFLANMSHEMRTPLNGILGYAQLLDQQLDLTDETARNLKALGQCGHHLLSVINDVLDMARIESGRLSLQMMTVIIPQLLSDVHSVIAPLASSHHLSFHLFCDDKTPEAIWSDGTRLRQILINLLNNAVKFTDMGEISLGVSVENERLLFKVNDTGCGIAEDHLNTIFQPFERLKLHQNTEGTGLGLAITHHLVQALQGTISVHSQPGQGSTFTVNLPCNLTTIDDSNTDDNDLLPSSLLPLTTTTPPRILVVDDDVTSRDVLCRLLESYGFAICSARDGKEALALMEAEPVDLVFSDLLMPVMTGMEFIVAVKEDPQLCNIPCIAISASIFQENIQSVTEAGFQAFLEKPFAAKKLLTTLYTILNIKPQHAENSKTNKVTSTSAVPTEQTSPVNFPPHLLHLFREPAEIGDIEHLHALINEHLSDPQYSTLKNELRQALNTLDVGKINQIVFERSGQEVAPKEKGQ